MQPHISFMGQALWHQIPLQALGTSSCQIGDQPSELEGKCLMDTISVTSLQARLGLLPEVFGAAL